MGMEDSWHPSESMKIGGKIERSKLASVRPLYALRRYNPVKFELGELNRA